MLGHFGFSYIGFLWLLMLLIPNFIWVKHQPSGYDNVHENKFLLAMERIGQVLVTCSALMFSDFNIVHTPWIIWLILSFFIMLLYEYFWYRYFKSEQTLRDFYSSICGIPVAGAILPVMSFFILGIYGKVIWMLIAITILGIGHIGIHLQHLHECSK